MIWEGIETDITERKNSERERERLARAIDVHFDAAYWMDPRGTLTYVNDAACRAVGYSQDELIGRSISLIAPRATPETIQRVWSRLRVEAHLAMESIHRRKDGTEFPVEIVAIYIHSDGEEVLCGFARDISQRKAAEQTLQQRLEELQRWQKVMLGRESRVQELKAEINDLCEQIGTAPRYPSQAMTSASDTRGSSRPPSLP